MIRWLSTLIILATLCCGAARALVVDPARLGATSPGAVVLDSLGLLWIGTRNGLYTWDSRHLMGLDSRDGWEGGGVAALAIDERGRLWAAADSGLYFREESFQKVELHSPVALGRGRALLVEGESVWLATERGLLLWQARAGERVLLSGIQVSCLARLPGGDLVCGTVDRGIYRFDAVGNPAAMRESYRQVVKDVLSLIRESSGDLLVLGRLGGRAAVVARLEAAGGALLALPATVPAPPPNAGDATPRLRLARAGERILLQSGASWHIWVQDHFQPITLEKSVLALPVAGLLSDAPQLAWLKPEGRLELQSTARGMVTARRNEMVLAWESPDEPGGWQPLQVCEVLDRTWVLLGSGAERRLLETGPAGTREFESSYLPREEKQGAFRPETICVDPDGRSLLLGLADRILRFRDGRVATLSHEFGAHWMVPFTDKSVLIAGPGGLALLEDDELLRLRVREPVHRAIPDGFRGILAACDQHVLRLNELNELDTLLYPEGLRAAGGDPAASPGSALRQILADAGGRIWLLGHRGLFLRAREGAPWTRPLEGVLGATGAKPGDESAAILSMASDATGRLWLSTSSGTGWLVPDRLPPVVQLLQDPRELDRADRRLVLLPGVADPLGVGPLPLIRWRLDDQPWGGWRRAAPIPLDELLPRDMDSGTYRLQLQALDAWGNLSRQTLILPLVFQEGGGRIPFVKRFFLLLSMVALSLLATFFYPGRGGLLFSLGIGLVVGSWVYLNTEEPLLWWALPIILGLSSWQATSQIAARRNREKAAPEPGILDVVDLLRDFGHSGSATRNIDRLLRSARNLYLDGIPDEVINGRFQSARGVFLDLTAPSLEHLLAAFHRLRPGDSPLDPRQLSLLEERIVGTRHLLETSSNPPTEAALQDLSFQLDRLEKTLVDVQHRVDLKISSSPLKVLDRVLEDRSAELAGVELHLQCERDVRRVLARLPVDKLQFILDNLVDNALHWMKERPGAHLGIELRERPATLQIRVTDNGPGIPLDRRERIFEAGVSGREGQDGAGRGYGLYRSREILARFAGRLEVEASEPGVGSTFLLEIKKVEPEERAD